MSLCSDNVKWPVFFFNILSGVALVQAGRRSRGDRFTTPQTKSCSSNHPTATDGSAFFFLWMQRAISIRGPLILVFSFLFNLIFIMMMPALSFTASPLPFTFSVLFCFFLRLMGPFILSDPRADTPISSCVKTVVIIPYIQLQLYCEVSHTGIYTKARGHCINHWGWFGSNEKKSKKSCYLFLIVVAPHLTETAFFLNVCMFFLNISRVMLMIAESIHGVHQQMPGIDSPDIWSRPLFFFSVHLPPTSLIPLTWLCCENAVLKLSHSCVFLEYGI